MKYFINILKRHAGATHKNFLYFYEINTTWHAAKIGLFLSKGNVYLNHIISKMYYYNFHTFTNIINYSGNASLNCPYTERHAQRDQRHAILHDVNTNILCTIFSPRAVIGTMGPHDTYSRVISYLREIIFFIFQ